MKKKEGVARFSKQQTDAAAKKEKNERDTSVLFIIASVLLVLVVTFYMTAFLSGCQLRQEPAAVPDGATLETAVATHYVTIEIENYGTIRAELYGYSAPKTVENFVKLAQSGFYEGRDFHRIIPGFMMQGGAAEQGNSLTPIEGEFSENGVVNNLKHVRGVLSMARTNQPDSATSQFFIMHQNNEGLDGRYAAFGMVTEGIHVVDAICAAVHPGENGAIEEKERPVILSVTVTPAES